MPEKARALDSSPNYFEFDSWIVICGAGMSGSCFRKRMQRGLYDFLELGGPLSDRVFPINNPQYQNVIGDAHYVAANERLQFSPPYKRKCVLW